MGDTFAKQLNQDVIGHPIYDRATERQKVQLVTATANGAINEYAELVQLSSTTPLIAATIAKPRPGRFLVITQVDGGTAGHTVTLAAGTFDGTNDVATFNAAAESLVLYGVSDTRFLIVENLGAVAFS
jgi:hypothetical protein